MSLPLHVSRKSSSFQFYLLMKTLGKVDIERERGNLMMCVTYLCRAKSTFYFRYEDF